jgi:hypothetical protein
MEQFEIDYLTNWKKELEVRLKEVKKEYISAQNQFSIFNLKQFIINGAIMSASKDFKLDSDSFKLYAGYDEIEVKRKNLQDNLSEMLNELRKEDSYLTSLINQINMEINSKVAVE